MSAPTDRPAKKAVALRYDPQQAAAPQVVASGRNEVAERIVAAARDAGVHVHQDSELAGLLETLPLGEEIPAELYTVIAEILAFVYRVDRQQGG